MQITTNAQRNQNSASTTPPVTKETDVTYALRGSREPSVRNVPNNTTEMIAVMFTFYNY